MNASYSFLLISMSVLPTFLPTLLPLPHHACTHWRPAAFFPDTFQWMSSSSPVRPPLIASIFVLKSPSRSCTSVLTAWLPAVCCRSRTLSGSSCSAVRAARRRFGGAMASWIAGSSSVGSEDLISASSPMLLDPCGRRNACWGRRSGVGLEPMPEPARQTRSVPGGAAEEKRPEAARGVTSNAWAHQLARRQAGGLQPRPRSRAARPAGPAGRHPRADAAPARRRRGGAPPRLAGRRDARRRAAARRRPSRSWARRR